MSPANGSFSLLVCVASVPRREYIATPFDSDASRSRLRVFCSVCVCVFSPCANVSTRHSSVSRHWPLLRATTWHTYASTPWRARCISYGPSCTRARFPAPTDHQDSDPSTTNKYSKAPLKSSTPATTALLRYPSKSTLANSHSDGTPLS
jgi:hypothetical protein